MAPVPPSTVTVVERTSLLKGEEDAVQKLEELADQTGVGLPQLRAVGIDGGAGWAMDVIVGSDVLAKAQHANRAVAGDMVLTSALKNFPCVVMPQPALSVSLFSFALIFCTAVIP